MTRTPRTRGRKVWPWWFGTAYLGIAVLNYGAMTATFQHECHHDWPHVCDARNVRQDEAFAALVSLSPPGWITTLAITGAFQDGLEYRPVPDPLSQGNPRYGAYRP